jgi:uncharacterized protein with HEPN domain
VIRKDPNVFLAHARDCAARVLAYTQGERASLDDPKTQDAVLRNLEIIGQCFKDANLDLLEETYPDVPWRDVAAFRNVLAHAYLGINLEIVWEVVVHRLPALQSRLDQILDKWTP